MQSLPNSLWTVVNKFDSSDMIGLVAVILAFSVAATFIICMTVYHIHKNRAENALKRELLDRGLSAQEIATIVQAAKTLPENGTRLRRCDECLAC